ncbi:hypothetical protein AB0F72_17540 [Actinoplanes sp. NPDC023936]|uniref:NACHT domain-containing protein n=1 Tax=Actinoplanes sp. NPDC023936 TaxID=3154910 RepID=UPI0033FE9C56
MTADPAANRALQSYAAMSKSAFGRRRTAFPLDMTLADLIERRIAIAPRIVDRTRRDAATTPSAILGRMHPKRSAVMLGAPGAGKSMALLQAAAAWSTATVTPVLLRITDAVEELETLQKLISQSTGRPPVLLLDGLDEAMAPQDYRPQVAKALRTLMNAAPTILTSRSRDFEEASYLDANGIVVDDVYELMPWRPDVEFAQFVQRLHTSGHISNTKVLDDVSRSPQLSRLATRPLHARMLTFIMEVDPARPPESQNDLYGTYLYHLARVADASLAGRGCHLPQGALGFWMDVVWAAYTSRTATPDPHALVKATAAGDGHYSACLRSAIDIIADRVPHAGRERLEFVHYSFYEWLLAARIRERLSEFPMTVDQLFETLSRDVPREVRHYLRHQTGTMSPQLTNDLVAQYLKAHERITDTQATLVVCNLIVYLISRCAPDAVVPLRRLLGRERDPFLTNALLWSLTHLGDRAATVDFFRRFSDDEHWRRMARGYTLYYYGDLTDVSGPPYLDSPPLGPYDRSLQAHSGIFASAASENIPLERQAVDLVTILDILHVRNIRVTRERLASIVDAAQHVTEGLGVPDVTRQIQLRLSSVLT